MFAACLAKGDDFRGIAAVRDAAVQASAVVRAPSRQRFDQAPVE
jgi:hypothetical protein